MKGFLDFWNPTKAYGFVKDDAGCSYFVHISAIQPGVNPIAGVAVTFDAGRTSKGAVALDVQIVQGGGK